MKRKRDRLGGENEKEEEEERRRKRNEIKKEGGRKKGKEEGEKEREKERKLGRKTLSLYLWLALPSFPTMKCMAGQWLPIMVPFSPQNGPLRSQPKLFILVTGSSLALQLALCPGPIPTATPGVLHGCHPPLNLPPRPALCSLLTLPVSKQPGNKSSACITDHFLGAVKAPASWKVTQWGSLVPFKLSQPPLPAPTLCASLSQGVRVKNLFWEFPGSPVLKTQC